MALVGELVDPLARPGGLVVPLGADDALGLEETEEAVEVAHVDPLARHLGELLEQFVAVHGALAKEEEHRRLREALDARSHVVLAGRDPPPDAHGPPMASVRPHPASTCKRHMYRASVPVGVRARLGYSRRPCRSPARRLPAPAPSATGAFSRVSVRCGMRPTTGTSSTSARSARRSRPSTGG